MQDFQFPHVVLVNGQPHLPRSVVDPDPEQHRKHFCPVKLKELASSIKENGIQQPLQATFMPESGRFKLKGGERRWRASGMVDENFLLPVFIKPPQEQRQDFLEGVIENVQRVDPQPMEEAAAYAKILQDYPDWTAKDVGEKVGKSYVHIEYYMALLELHPMLQGMVKDKPENGQLSVGQGWQIVCAARDTESPHDTQFRIIKAMQEGQPLTELVKAVRNQTAMAEQGAMFEVDAPPTPEAKEERAGLEKQLAAMMKFCEKSWDAKTCAVAVSAFGTNELDKTVEQMKLIEQSLAKTRKALAAESARRKLFNAPATSPKTAPKATRKAPAKKAAPRELKQAA